MLIDLDDVQPTNMVKYIAYLRDGTERIELDGPIKETDLPAPGDGKLVDGVGCRVTGIAKTPMLPFTWHVFCKEH